MLSSTVGKQSSGWVLYSRFWGSFNFLLYKKVEQKLLGTSKSSLQAQDNQTSVSPNVDQGAIPSR